MFHLHLFQPTKGLVLPMLNSVTTAIAFYPACTTANKKISLVLGGAAVPAVSANTIQEFLYIIKKKAMIKNPFQEGYRSHARIQIKDGE